VLEKTRPNGDVVRYNPSTDELASYQVGGVFAHTTSLILQCMAGNQIWTISMLSSNKKHVCPVCGYPDLNEPAYDSFGCASYNICPCCGTEFGYDDSTAAHADLRGKWISDGMQWWSKHQLKPDDWDPVRQLKNNY